MKKVSSKTISPPSSRQPDSFLLEDLIQCGGELVAGDGVVVRERLVDIEHHLAVRRDDDLLGAVQAGADRRAVGVVQLIKDVARRGGEREVAVLILLVEARELPRDPFAEPVSQDDLNRFVGERSPMSDAEHSH